MLRLNRPANWSLRFHFVQLRFHLNSKFYASTNAYFHRCDFVLCFIDCNAIFVSINKLPSAICSNSCFLLPFLLYKKIVKKWIKFLATKAGVEILWAKWVSMFEYYTRLYGVIHIIVVVVVVYSCPEWVNYIVNNKLPIVNSVLTRWMIVIFSDICECV